MSYDDAYEPTCELRLKRADRDTETCLLASSWGDRYTVELQQKFVLRIDGEIVSTSWREVEMES